MDCGLEKKKALLDTIQTTTTTQPEQQQQQERLAMDGRGATAGTGLDRKAFSPLLPLPAALVSLHPASGRSHSRTAEQPLDIIHEEESVLYPEAPLSRVLRLGCVCVCALLYSLFI